MTIDFKIEIAHWTIVPKVGPFRDVVTHVKWRMFATDGVHTEQRTSTVRLPAPTNPRAFTPKNKITKEMVIEWIKPLMGYDAYVEQMTAHIKGTHEADSRPLVEVPHFNIETNVSPDVMVNGTSATAGNIGTAGNACPAGNAG